MSYFPFGGVLVDIGCDVPPVLINKVKKRMKKCIGLEIAVESYREENVEVINIDLQKKIDLPSKSADVITMLAVLEHMKHPKEILIECCRILKPGGVILITVPSPRNEPLLKIFAALRLVRPEMIDQHENYFTVDSLKKLLVDAGFSHIEVKLFELGLNTFARAKKE